MEKKQKNLEGIITITSKGSGYVAIPDFKEDVEIPEGKTGTAFHGDVVLIKTLPKTHRRLQGEVVNVVTRKKETFVGTIIEEKGRKIFVADNRKIHTSFSISGNAKIGYKVLGKLLPWTNAKEKPQIEVVQDIGRKGDNTTEMNSIVLDRGFSPTFPNEVENEALSVKNSSIANFNEEIKNRRDIRKTLTFTIDPADAKDFDDAISFKKLSPTTYEIGIHIADVSHYVRPDTELDREAQKRATSIYLVDRTIPMLPEILSNELCSLNQNEDKFTFSAIFEMNNNGEVLKSWFGKTIINSNKRFIYEEAQESILGKKEIYKEELQILNGIAKKLLAERTKKGAISFEQDEVKFVLDKNGKPLRVIRKIRFDAHKLVEEFMLLANREVARFINKIHKPKRSGDIPLFLYRIHDVPDYEKIAELSIFVKALGHELPLNNGHVTGKDLNSLFKRLEGKAEESIVKTATIRSMAKAIYSIKNIGHYGLAFDYYTHFTSPIRRYPDTLVHRLLQKYLEGKKISSSEFIFYEKMGSHSTEAEIRASEAERESIKLKQVEYMQDKIGIVFDGIISGVTEWGMYIEEKETKSEGLVRLRDLKNDYYKLDKKNYCLVGEKTKKKYSLGDSVKFKITSADLERKTLDLQLI
ncbi:MAG: ribonuclease R [Patescibacteria group bacterium]